MSDFLRSVSATFTQLRAFVEAFRPCRVLSCKPGSTKVNPKNQWGLLFLEFSGEAQVERCEMTILTSCAIQSKGGTIQVQCQYR